MNDTSGGARLPLYRQVKAQLVRRMASGEWMPGMALPSEQDLAVQLAVSQGTVRKALDELTSENLVVRRQGRGTFVARHGEGKFLFQFFKLLPDAGPPKFPDSRMLGMSCKLADEQVRERLQLARASTAVHLRRMRWLEAEPCVLEDIFVPGELFPGLEKLSPPNNLYMFYSEQFAVTIGGGTEKVKAIALDPADAAILHVQAGTPALHIDRIALTLDSKPAEWRSSRCVTERMHYFSQLK